MAGPPGGLLSLTLLLAVSGVIADDGPPKWSQRFSRSSGGWIPIDTPCLTCRAAAEAAADMEVQASSAFATVPVNPPQPSSPVVFKDIEDLRPPPAPVRVQRQEGSSGHRPILGTYIENQRPPPPPIIQPTAGKQGRDHRFLYTHNLPRQQLQGFSLENQQHPRVVFPTHQSQVQAQDLGTSAPSVRPQVPLINQHLQPQTQLLQQQTHQQQPLRPQKQIRLQSVPHDQFPLILPPAGLGPPHGFQNAQIQLLPVPHSPQPTAAQVNLQNIFQQQLQNQFHHQINQQLLGAPLTSPFPPSAIGQPLEFHSRPSPLSPVNVQLIPQQQQVLRPIKPSPPTLQQLGTTPSSKPTSLPLTTVQADAPPSSPQKEKKENSFQANPEEDVEEEVQLLYVPVEALRQRDRVNKQVLQNQNTAPVPQRPKAVPDRQIAHSFEIKHFQNPEKKPLANHNLEVIQGNSGSQVANADGERSETELAKANQGQETIVREEKLLTFTPPRIQQFHESAPFQETHSLFPHRQFPHQTRKENFPFQTVQQVRPQEQQSQLRQHIQQTTRPLHQQFHRQPSVSQEDNSQRYYQDARQEVRHSVPQQTTSRPIATSPSTTSTTTQPSPPTSPAPYQPPLSVYMEDVEGQGPGTLSVDDVLRSLNGAKTVPVLERAGPNPPKVFVGPSVLRPPNGYAKFELPYLSMLDSNRVERKVDRLPFFVAPLSFQPPAGYAKIPFPAPHVGSVVVSSTPVVSTTERAFPTQVTTVSSVLPELVNSLQTSNVSPSGLEYTQHLEAVIPFTSTQQPRPLHGQNQQIYQQDPAQQQAYQQQNYQQQPQVNHQRVQNENINQDQQTLHQQLINQQNSQQNIPTQQQPSSLSQPHSFSYHSTPIPSHNPVYYSTPGTTTTTTTSTTTALPETRAPAHHSRGRTRQRPSYTQTTSTDSENNYRNRGTYRGGASTDTTRQPSTRTRRPWDGRRRPSTTTTDNVPTPDTYSFNNANQNYNPSPPPNEITSSTVRSTESYRNAYVGQSIKESSPTLIQQQYNSDEVYSPVQQPDTNSNEGQLRNQGAVVLSAFQQPQVLGDVITGQIQRPDDNNGFRNYYGGQREYTVSTFGSPPNVGVQPTLPQVQTSLLRTEQLSSVPKETTDGVRNRDELRPTFKSKDSQRGKAVNEHKTDIYSTYQQSRGQKYYHQQNLRGSEEPITQVQQTYQEEINPVTQGPFVETHFVTPIGQRAQTNEGGPFRNYNFRQSTPKDKNEGIQNVYSTQFTPSIEIHDSSNAQQNTPAPEISNVNANQHPQYFIISTPIPNPIHGLNKTYTNEQTYENHQSFIYPEVNQSPHLPKQNEPVAVLVNEGLLSKEINQQVSFGSNYKLPNIPVEQFVDESTTQLPKTTQTTTTQESYNIRTEEEPKRTRYRFPQKTGSSGSQSAHESPDVTNEGRPRYRGQQLRNSGETRTRQPGHRTRSRYHTTESPQEEESPAAPQRSQVLHQRYRGRQRTTTPANSVVNAEISESVRSHHSQSSPATEGAIPGIQSEHTIETYDAENFPTIVNPLSHPEEQLRKTERHRSSSTQITQENTQDIERPVHSRGRSRLRAGADRTANRQRSQIGNLNNEDISVSTLPNSRHPIPGQRHQHAPRRNPTQEVSYQESQRGHFDDTQQASLSYENPVQNTPLILKNEEETGYGANPIVTGSVEGSDQKITVNVGQAVGDFISSEVPINHPVISEHYEQPLPSVDAGSDYQEPATVPVTPPTTESITESTTAPIAAKPGRKYGNFVSRVGSSRRQSHVTAPLNSFPSTTPPTEIPHSNKVYTVRPARRPVARPTATTRIRIRRPTTPTTTTTTTESSYYLTTEPPAGVPNENPAYDTSSSFGNSRGSVRVRKRPVSRRPASASSNEVNQVEQEEEPARGGYRQRSRVPSRRVLPSPGERTGARWRQTDHSDGGEQLQPSPISQSPQGFKSDESSENADSYIVPQDNEESTKHQVSLPEGELASHIPTRALRTQGKSDTLNPSPVYLSREQYYTQESQESQEGQEQPLRYHSPPVRPSSFVVPDDKVYTYERARPFSSQPVAQTHGSTPDGNQQRGDYQEKQQDFVINFSGVSRAEDTIYPSKDELESGEETRYFDKVKPAKSKEKSYPEEEDGKIPEALAVDDIQPEKVATDHSDNTPFKSQLSQQADTVKVESKEPDANRESSEKAEIQPLKKVTGGRRRGNWVRVRTKVHRPRPGDTLETAESQNLASVSQNLLQFTTPLKEKSEASRAITPRPEDSTEEKQPEPIPTDEDAESGSPTEATEPNVESLDLELVDVREEEKEDARKEESAEDIFEDLENSDFTPTERESMDSEDEEKESSHLLPSDSQEYSSEIYDKGSGESNANNSQIPEKESTETIVKDLEDSQNNEERDVDNESSTEQPEDDYDQQQESFPHKSEESTEEAVEDTTDQPTPRVLGTSTTTEISLETEICYRGRCVKTKVDADQVPIE